MSVDDRSPYAVDVVIPVYNCERFLPDAIESAVHQSYKPNRVFVVDDGSTDRSREIALDWCRENEGVIELVAKKHAGLSSTRNAGIKKSTASLIAFIDSDDVWEEDKLEKQVQLFKEREREDKNFGVVYCDYSHIDEAGRPISNAPVTSPKETMRGRIFERLLHGNFISGSASAVLVKRECFEKAGLFDETLTGAEDWDMWLRVAEHFSFDFIPEKAVRIRLHRANMQKDSAAMSRNQAKLIDKWYDVVDRAYPQVKREWRSMIVSREFQAIRDPKVGFLILPLSRVVRMSMFRTTLGSIRLLLLFHVLAMYFKDCARALWRLLFAVLALVRPAKA